MNVLWQFPDGSLSENAVPDIEQFMLLLRLVNGVTLKGVNYQISGSELVVEDDRLYVAVTLLHRTDGIGEHERELPAT